MTNRMTVAEYLTKAIDLSGKTQRQVAMDAGYEKPNVLSMMKQGLTKVPIERIPALAKACGVDPARFLAIAMQEYMPETWQVLSQNLGEMLNDEEHRVLHLFREHRASSGKDDLKPLSDDELKQLLRDL